MVRANSTDVKNRFGWYLDESRKGPVEVIKSGSRYAVLLSTEEYDRLSSYEDAYWGKRALEALENGMTGPEEAMKTLLRGLHEEAVEDD
ncbi:hypothetical protein JCM15519_10710 [Fundidesulfovibrio butyratiphilus]